MDEWAYLKGQKSKRRYKGLGVANIEEKINENLLRWFGHVPKAGISEQIRQKAEPQET